MGTEFNLDTGLDVASSRKAADMAIAEYTKKFPQSKPFLRWTGEDTGEFGFSVGGSDIKGAAHVKDKAIVVRFGQLPFLASLFIPTAMDMVKEEVKVWAKKVSES